METKTALFCLGPAGKGEFEVRQVPRGIPAADEVEIAVEAASVNPIDVRRAEGYGRRLLSLLGAGKFPMVLGNDFVGTVANSRAHVSAVKPGDRVYGLKPASVDGTHAFTFWSRPLMCCTSLPGAIKRRWRRFRIAS